MQTDSVVILADFEDVSRAGLVAFGSIGFLVGDVGAEQTLGLRRARVFAGYAGRGPGHEEEVAERRGSRSRATRGGRYFAEAPERLWESVVDAQGRRLQVPAHHAVRPAR